MGSLNMISMMNINLKTSQLVFGVTMEDHAREFEQTPRDGEGQGNLACCSPWGRKESDTTEQPHNNGRICAEACRRAKTVGRLTEQIL